MADEIRIVFVLSLHVFFWREGSVVMTSAAEQVVAGSEGGRYSFECRNEVNIRYFSLSLTSCFFYSRRDDTLTGIIWSCRTERLTSVCILLIIPGRIIKRKAAYRKCHLPGEKCMYLLKKRSQAKRHQNARCKPLICFPLMYKDLSNHEFIPSHEVIAWEILRLHYFGVLVLHRSFSIKF